VSRGGTDTWGHRWSLLSNGMAIDPTANGLPSFAHVSLQQARILRTGMTSFHVAAPSVQVTQPGAATSQAARQTAAPSPSGTSFEPHTPISSSGSAANPDQWDAMLNRSGQKYNVPPLFLKAVMLSESGGRPDAVGDSGHSVGLFQLHDQGYGHGMGDSRYDPETNIDRASQGLAEAWHAGQRAGYSGGVCRPRGLRLLVQPRRRLCLPGRLGGEALQPAPRGPGSGSTDIIERLVRRYCESVKVLRAVL
jgi:hypothetical protein